MDGMCPITTQEESTALSFSSSISLPFNALLDSLVLPIPALTLTRASLSASSRTIISVLRWGRAKVLELELEFEVALELELEVELELELELEFGRLELEFQREVRECGPSPLRNVWKHVLVLT